MTPGLVLGLLRPATPSANPFGAFVNRNHFAGWLLMIVAPVGGYLLAHSNVHPEYRRNAGAALREALRTGSLLTMVGALISAGVIFMTLSRSAVAGLAAGLAAGWWLVRARLDVRRLASPFLFMATAAGLVMLLVFVDTDRWVARISSSFEPAPAGAGRLTIWNETGPIIRDFPVTGTGAGTFADAMTVYQRTRLWVGSMGKWTHFNSAHSHYLQLAAEGGMLLTLPVVLGICWLGVIGMRAMAADRSHIYWVRAGAAVGLIAIAVQSIWEVPLVMPANAVVAAVLAALVVHERPSAAMATPRAGVTTPRLATPRPARANERP
jgi:O-antigen ligase